MELEAVDGLHKEANAPLDVDFKSKKEEEKETTTKQKKPSATMEKEHPLW